MFREVTRKKQALSQEECIELLASGRLDPEIHTCKFEEIGEGIEKLRRGEVSGRLVCVYD